MTKTPQEKMIYTKEDRIIKMIERMDRFHAAIIAMNPEEVTIGDVCEMDERFFRLSDEVQKEIKALKILIASN